jgi:hypothetical protein
MLASAAFAAFRSTVILEWTMSAGSTIPDAFVLHSSNDLTAPLTNWPVYTVFASDQVWSLTNQVYSTNTTNRATIPITPGSQFFYLVCSNLWGESVPSPIAGTPALPTNGVLRIR